MTIALRPVLVAGLSFCLASAAAAWTVDLEDVGANLPSGGLPYDNGATGGGGFSSRGVDFNNEHQDGFWSGFAYSQVTDNTTPGFGNQYSAFPGQGSDGSATYAVGFQDFFGGNVPTLSFGAAQQLVGVQLSNTTYAALSMLEGDAFARRFGEPPGGGPGISHPDWFLLTLTGFDDLGSETGVIDFYLADYRFADDRLDFVVDTWTYVDLSGLGSVRSITFELSGSDVGGFGLNTPSYFALDNLIVPEPSSGQLLGLCLVVLGLRRIEP